MEIFFGLVVIAIIVTVIRFGISYPLIPLGIGAIWLVIHLINEAEKEKYERLKKTKEERRLKEAQFKYQQEKQESYYKEMIDLGGNSLNLFELLPKGLEKAEKYLDQAEVDFSDGAFAPFWDSIEEATKSLSYFVKGIQLIKEKSSQYTKVIGEYEGVPPQFPLLEQSIEKLGVGTATAKRMDSIVRSAQCNYHFATIYEQRKTNQILVAGFTSLADALREMTWIINDSIADLATSVGETGLMLNESMSMIQSQIGHIADDFTEEASEREKRGRKALEILDNIQHDRRPLL